MGRAILRLVGKDERAPAPGWREMGRRAGDVARTARESGLTDLAADAAEVAAEARRGSTRETRGSGRAASAEVRSTTRTGKK